MPLPFSLNSYFRYDSIETFVIQSGLRDQKRVMTPELYAELTSVIDGRMVADDAFMIESLADHIHTCMYNAYCMSSVRTIRYLSESREIDYKLFEESIKTWKDPLAYRDRSSLLITQFDLFGHSCCKI